MSALVYIIDTPSIEDALHTARELEQLADITPIAIRDSGITYKYDSDSVSAVLDGEKTTTEYMIENSIQ